MSSRALDLLCRARRRAQERAEAEPAARGVEVRQRQGRLGVSPGGAAPGECLRAGELAAAAGQAARELAALERLRAAEAAARARVAAASSLREAAEALRRRLRERERREADRRAEVAAEEAALGPRCGSEGE